MISFLENDTVWRLSLFGGILGSLLVAETFLPRRPRKVPRGRHLLHNLLLGGLNVGVARLLPILSLVAAAQWSEGRGWGIFHLWDLPGWVQTSLTLLLFDLLIYAQHVAMHYVPLLWRLHKVHHADLDLDASSGVRFHTVEILLSLALKCGFVILLGARASDLLLFEIILNGMSMFNHSNLRLPLGLDWLLRKLVVTPDMHRVHHSIEREETNSNYGFNLSWWDMLFRTYRPHPRGEHTTMPLGLAELRSEKETVSIWKMLGMPFRK